MFCFYFCFLLLFLFQFDVVLFLLLSPKPKFDIDSKDAIINPYRITQESQWFKVAIANRDKVYMFDDYGDISICIMPGVLMHFSQYEYNHM